MERRLIAMLLSPDSVPSAPDEGSVLNLGSPLDGYGPEWHMVSHTMTFRPDGNGAVLTFVLERQDGT